MKTNELQEVGVDKRVKIYKAFSGIIPGGSFIAELCIDKIPEWGRKGVRPLCFFHRRTAIARVYFVTIRVSRRSSQ